MEDASQAHGAIYHGQHIGAIGDIATFSFYPGKNLGAYGDAGALTTNNYGLANFAMRYSNHGGVSKFQHEFEGINSRLDEMQAAVLNVKMKYIDDWTSLRIAHVHYYMNNLDKTWGYSMPANGIKHVYHLFVVRCELRNELIDFLKQRHILAGIHYPTALPFLPAYQHKNHQIHEFPVAQKLSGTVLSLPLYPELTSNELDHIIGSLNEFQMSPEYKPGRN